MKHAPDMKNPITDQVAAQFYCRMPDDERRSLGGQTGIVWENAEPAMRDVMRERARRFLAGDLSMLPWTWPIGMIPTAPSPTSASSPAALATRSGAAPM